MAHIQQEMYKLLPNLKFHIGFEVVRGRKKQTSGKKEKELWRRLWLAMQHKTI